MAPAPLTKILVPVDGSEPCQRAVAFTGCLTAGLKGRITEITLLHVLTGGYFCQSMDSVDIHTAKLRTWDEFNIFRKNHIKQRVAPMFADAREELMRRGATGTIIEKTYEGMPARVIANLADEDDFSTIIISRRGLTETKEFFLGSVTSSLLHRAKHPTTYVVGRRLLANAEECLLPRLLLMLDGSPHSLAAVREAAIMATAYGSGFEKIFLLHVVDLTTYVKKAEQGSDQAGKAKAILAEGAAILEEAGIKNNRIEPLALFGKPVETALKIIDRENITLLMLGRRGRSAIKDLVIGGVSNTLLHRSQDPTIGIICGDATC